MQRQEDDMTRPGRSASGLRNNDTMPRGPSGTHPAVRDDKTADGIAHAMTGGQRDFASTPTLQADQAREVLSRLPTDPRR
jgi:hypothetical protein